MWKRGNWPQNACSRSCLIQVAATCLWSPRGQNQLETRLQSWPQLETWQPQKSQVPQMLVEALYRTRYTTQGLSAKPWPQSTHFRAASWKQLRTQHESMVVMCFDSPRLYPTLVAELRCWVNRLKKRSLAAWRIISNRPKMRRVVTFLWYYHSVVSSTCVAAGEHSMAVSSDQKLPKRLVVPLDPHPSWTSSMTPMAFARNKGPKNMNRYELWQPAQHDVHQQHAVSE